MKRGLFLIIGLVVLITIITVIVVFASKGPQQPSQVTLKVWSPFDEQKTFDKLSETFLSAHSGLKIDYRFIDAVDAKDYEARVVNEIANGSGPDIWLIRSDWIPKHANKSQPAPAVNKSTSAPAYLKERLRPSLVDLNTYQDKLYGLPLSVDSLAVIYNGSLLDNLYASANADQKKVLEAKITSWDQLKADASILSKSKGASLERSMIALGTAGNTFVASDLLSALLAQEQVSILSSDGKDIGFNLARVQAGQASFPAQEALDFYTSFARVGQANYSWNSSLGDPIDAFLAGKTMSLIGYYSTLKTILKAKPNFTVKVGPMVQKQADQERQDYVISWSLAVNNQTKNPDLAWQYLDYLGQKDILSQYAQATDKLIALPDPNSSVSEVLVDSGSAQDLFAGQFDFATPFIKPEWQLVDQVFQDMINQVTVSGSSSQAAVDTAAERFKVFLSP